MFKLTPKKVVIRIFFYLLLLVFFLFIAIPMYWCFVTSCKSNTEIVAKEVTLWPANFSFANYSDAWVRAKFATYFKNSAVIAIGGVIGITITSIMTGYALDRFNFKGKGAFMLALLCTQFIPGAMLLIPMFILFKTLGLLNSLFALVIINITFQTPFNSILMRGFIHGIDYTIEEAAQIDGCNRIQTMFKVLFPLLKPGIATIAAYGFISCWNEFLYGFMFINKRTMFTLPVGLKGLIGEYVVNYGTLAAGALIAVIPTLILFSYVQKNLVGGLSAGGVKG